MELQGTVRNVIDFGVFVDIGIHQDGLVHISKLPRRVKHPSEHVLQASFFLIGLKFAYYP